MLSVIRMKARCRPSQGKLLEFAQEVKTTSAMSTNEQYVQDMAGWRSNLLQAMRTKTTCLKQPKDYPPFVRDEAIWKGDCPHRTCSSSSASALCGCSLAFAFALVLVAAV